MEGGLQYLNAVISRQRDQLGANTMKYKRLFFLSLIISAIVSTGLHAGENEQNWTLIGFTKYRDAIFVHNKSIFYLPDGRVSAWIIIEPSGKSKYLREAQGELKKAGTPSKGLKSIEILNGIDCTRNQIRQEKTLYLNNNGETIHFTSSATPEWKTIDQTSIWFGLLKRACKK